MDTPDPIGGLFKLVTEEFWLKSLQPFLSKRFTARQLVLFFAKLPFHVPVDGLVTVQVYESNHGLAFGFRSASEALQIDPAGAAFGVSNLSVPRTTVEMVCALPDHLPKEQRVETLPDILERLVYGLNLFLRAYIVTHRDLDVFPITEKALPLAVFFRIVDPRNWDQPEDGMLGLHTDLPALGKPPLGIPSRDEVARRATLLQSGANPFFLSQEMAAAAFRWLRDGWDRDAVVNAQTSVETLVGALTIQLEVADGASIEKATTEYTARATKAFLWAIKNLQHFIGGSWDLSRASNPPGAWHASCYLLRNRIVHAGYSPSHDEARAACRSAEDFRVYIARLLGKKKRYGQVYERLRETGVEDWAKV